MALVEFIEASDARKAFKTLAYKKFKHVPLYLEWAPLGCFSEQGKGEKSAVGLKKRGKGVDDEDEEQAVDQGEGESATVFVKNLNFTTKDDSLKQVLPRFIYITRSF